MKMKKVYVMIAIFLAFIMSSSTYGMAAELGAASVGSIGAESGSVSGALIVENENEEPLIAGGPSAEFSYQFSSTTCYFTDQSIPGDAPIIAWQWSFGDGATSTEQNPEHNYQGYAGEYKTVTLSVMDDNGICDSITKDVKVPKTSVVEVEGTIVEAEEASVEAEEASVEAEEASVEAEETGVEVESEFQSSSTSTSSTTSTTTSETSASSQSSIELINSDDEVGPLFFGSCDLHLYNVDPDDEVIPGTPFYIAFKVIDEWAGSPYDGPDLIVKLTSEPEFGVTRTWELPWVQGTNYEVSFDWPLLKIGKKYSITLTIYTDNGWYDEDDTDNDYLFNAGFKSVETGIVNTGTASISGSASTSASSSYQSSSSSSSTSQSSYQSQATNYGSFSL